MNDNLFKIIDGVQINDKEKLYQLMLQSISTRSEAKVMDQLKTRESSGNILIAEQVILPHVESEEILQSKIVITRLEHATFWSSEIGNVKLIIAIVLKKEESENIKREIAQFSRKLAEEEYIEFLLNTVDLKLIDKE